MCKTFFYMCIIHVPNTFYTHKHTTHYHLMNEDLAYKLRINRVWLFLKKKLGLGWVKNPCNQI